jgi:hypothetical protein
MLGNGIYVSTNTYQLVADEVQRTFPRTAVWQVVTPMSIDHTWLTKKILKRSVMLVSNMLSENISLFNPNRSFPIQINIFQSSSLATLNKKEFIVVKGNAQWVHSATRATCSVAKFSIVHPLRSTLAPRTKSFMYIQRR